MEFRKYVIYRLVTMVAIIMILLTFIFFAVHIIPGDPVEAMVGEGASQEFVDQIRRRLGLDKPLHLQYFDYISGVFRGDFGYSIIYSTSVNAIIVSRAGVTIQLAVLSWIFSSGLGIILGKYSARKAGKAQDHALRGITLFLYAIPVYVLGILCQIVFGLWLGILPVFGTKSPSVRPPTVTGMILIGTRLGG